MVVWQCQISLKAVSKNYNNINININNDNNDAININHHNNIIIVAAIFLGNFFRSNLSNLSTKARIDKEKIAGKNAANVKLLFE